jgi:hypothetical protein
MAFWQGRVTEATSLARRHSHAPHFSRSLEWLLFTSLEFNADDAPSPAKMPPLGALAPHQHSPECPRRGTTAGALLLAAATLIRNFPQVCLTVLNLLNHMRSQELCQSTESKGVLHRNPAGSAEMPGRLMQFQDIVVSVARKTDAAMWPALFLAVGVPSELLNNLVDAGALASAACCLLIVDRIEGSAAAHASALRLIKVRSLHVLVFLIVWPAQYVLKGTILS